MSDLLAEIGENNRAFAAASKILALAEIAIDTGKAISAGVASAMKVPFPANLVAVATTITTVMANITNAIKTVKSAKFAEGGLVTGPGSGTSDSIPAHLSNGESVMTSRATEMFAPVPFRFQSDRGRSADLRTAVEQRDRGRGNAGESCRKRSGRPTPAGRVRRGDHDNGKSGRCT